MAAHGLVVRAQKSEPADKTTGLTVVGTGLDTGRQSGGEPIQVATNSLRVFSGMCTNFSYDLHDKVSRLAAAQQAMPWGGSSLEARLHREVVLAMQAGRRAFELLDQLGKKVRATAHEYEVAARRVESMWYFSDFGAVADYFRLINAPLLNTADRLYHTFMDKLFSPLFGTYAPTLTTPLTSMARLSFLPFSMLPGTLYQVSKMRNFMKILPCALPEPLRQIVEAARDLPFVNLDRLIMGLSTYFVTHLSSSLGEPFPFTQGDVAAIVRELAAAFGYEKSPQGVAAFTRFLGARLLREGKVKVRKIPPPAAPNSGPFLEQGRLSGHQTVTETPVVDTFAGLVSGFEQLSPLEEDVVRIDKITNDDGSLSWQLFIPGTNGSIFEHSKPWTWFDAVPAVGGLPTPGLQGLMEVLENAGVQSDEPVTIVGHSQGGALAMNVADLGARTGQFTVTGVVSVGAPVSNAALPDFTHLVSLEHTEDIVAAADGGVNPMQENITTIYRSLTQTPTTVSTETGVHLAHNYPAYIETAEMLDSDPSVESEFAREQIFRHINPGARVESSFYEIIVDPKG